MIRRISAGDTEIQSRRGIDEDSDVFPLSRVLSSSRWPLQYLLDSAQASSPSAVAFRVTIVVEKAVVGRRRRRKKGEGGRRRENKRESTRC
jgi:hypothetical protein